MDLTGLKAGPSANASLQSYSHLGDNLITSELRACYNMKNYVIDNKQRLSILGADGYIYIYR